MNRIRIFLFFFLFSCFACEIQHTETQKKNIIGGKEDIRYAAIGALTRNQISFCTGTLISSKIILTAAHCIDAALRYVRSGNTLQFRAEIANPQAKDGYDFEYFDLDPKLFLTHPNWNQILYDGNDIGFGILKQDVTTITPLSVNYQPLDASMIGKKVLFLGYGLLESTPTYRSAKRKNSVELSMTSLLSDRFVVYEKTQSICHGDSGGPALLMFNGALRVIGVNSYVSAASVPGGNRSSCTGTGTAMRVDTFSSFVQSIVEKHSSLQCKVQEDCSPCQSCGGDSLCKLNNSTSIGKLSCKACQNHQDCQGGFCYPFSNGYRCVSRCDAKGCCPTSTFCEYSSSDKKSEGVCLPFASSCPDVACKTDQDCGLGEECQWGVCLAPLVAKKKSFCQKCSDHSDCLEGLCLNQNGEKRCSQNCLANLFCPADFRCESVLAGYPKQCISTQDSCRTSCLYSKDCATNEYCVQGACFEQKEASQGQSCDRLPCQKGLTCLGTNQGKICLETCGIETKQAGSLCDGSSCQKELTCLEIRGDKSFCFSPCANSQECGALGGGFCSSGVCFCQKDADCQKDFICNNTSQYLGACVAKTQYKNCSQSDFSCESVEGTSVCVKSLEGDALLGEKCNAFHRCKTGLECVATEAGSYCFESCAGGKSCALGGECKTADGKEICSCSEDKATQSCLGGRKCRQIPLLSNYSVVVGLCNKTTLHFDCLDDKECPSQWKCQAGSCLDPNRPVVAEEIKEEKIELPPKEMAKGQEAIQKDSVEKMTFVEKNIPEDASVQESKSEEKKKSEPQEGCACSSSSTSFFSWFPFFFAIFFLCYKRKQNNPLQELSQ